ncbi:flagellar hook-associated protein FlgL [Rhodoferax ferrireducens]|uniref:flagellar hook-associated protein FlgL n=1 Tax=Rhodoferax ferrireducens TaxID=192843 RepID=UPI00298D7B60|nr:flagellar hook-associated protein FlgL [Rhodoferax ferrireducens]WPC66504.1 flagellar hook-associated protein FlgL [Rhodoferax ferrireducens]
MTSSLTRLGSANTYDNALRNLSMRQSALSNLQENLTSGKKVVRASDDPTGAAQAERAMTRISRIATDQRALEAQRNSIAMAEGTLGDVTDALQNFRELVVSAGNGVLTSAERKSITIQLQGLRDQVFSLANRKDSNGQPLFSALGSALAPFVGPNAPPQDYAFNGLPGQSASSEVAIPFALDGDSAFMLQTNRDGVYNVSLGSGTTNLKTGPATLNPPTAATGASYTISFTSVTAAAGNTTASYDIVDSGSGAAVATGTKTYSTGQSFTVTEMPGLSLTITGTPTVADKVKVESSPSLFSVLDDAISSIGSASSNAIASQAVSQALGNIDIGMGRVSAVRGQAGDLLNRADRITSNQEARSIQLEADRSRAEDLDMVKGIADFQNQQTGYQAALQSYAQVQKLSLFNYIS